MNEWTKIALEEINRDSFLRELVHGIAGMHKASVRCGADEATVQTHFREELELIILLDLTSSVESSSQMFARFFELMLSKIDYSELAQTMLSLKDR